MTELIGGMKVHTSRFMVEREGTTALTVLRRWRERLFSWPWRPLRKTKTVQVPRYVPSRQVLVVNRELCIMHPELWEELKRYMKEAV